MKLFLFFLISMLLSSGILGLSTDDPITRCSESCVKINPYNTTLDHPPESSVVRHCAKVTLDGKCECDWEKIVTSEGRCECRNPLHFIDDNNNCVCDLKKCLETSTLMPGCRGNLKLKDGTLDECCPQYECDECPDDSYRSNHTQYDKCICFPCKKNICKNNQSTLVVRKGNQKPGTCCDLYKCDDLPEKKGCIADGKIHPDGDSWLQDGCTLYTCVNGIIFHELLDDCENKKFCFSKGKIYPNGQSWTEDECTNCTCVNGVNKCMAHFCKDLPSATIRPREDECPSMSSCKKLCPFGFKVNRRGCEICKCKQPDAKTIQDILKMVNCTAESCEVQALPSVCSGRNSSGVNCPKCPEPSAPSNTFWPSVLLTSTASLALLSAVLLCLLLRERRRALCSLHRAHGAPSTPDKYLHIPMFDANLNAQDNKAAMLLSATGKPEKDYR